MTDLRRHKRKPLAVEFRCRDESGAGTLQFGSGDLSAGGAFLRSDLLLEQGERLWLELELPGRERPVRAEARVAWVRRFPSSGQEGGMGIEFLGMTDEDRRAVESFVEGA
jgi:uncharacterized protein (TIGR02266 family)